MTAVCSADKMWKALLELHSSEPAGVVKGPATHGNAKGDRLFVHLGVLARREVRVVLSVLTVQHSGLC